jgi:hypothetical protein
MLMHPRIVSLIFFNLALKLHEAVIDLLVLLVNFGYYVDQDSLSKLIKPLRALINGRKDVVSEESPRVLDGVKAIFINVKDKVTFRLAIKSVL